MYLYLYLYQPWSSYYVRTLLTYSDTPMLILYNIVIIASGIEFAITTEL